MHHTAQPTSEQVQAHLPFFEPQVLAALPADPPRLKPGKRGSPQRLSWSHLWFQLIFGVLTGMDNYQDLRRKVAGEPLGPFACITITDDGIIKRLRQAGLAPLQELLAHLSQRLGHLLASQCPCPLAPFASEIMALDETTWDAVQRHLPALRALPTGDVGLMGGKMAGRFNLRTQLWDLVQFRDNPVGNCKLDCCSLVQGLPLNTLLLFDLGYFSFAFFDYLTQMHFWFISRLREDVQYQIAHTFYRQDGTLDALVWLGATGRNSSRSASLVRLIRFWDGKQMCSYLTNQTDPQKLSLPDIARLYARRWDIELAFLTLKEHLGLHHWWSGIDVLRKQQALIVLIVAQLLNATRLLIAAEQGCDPFEVSFPLLVKYLPKHLKEHPVVWAIQHGHAYDLFRPSSRCVIVAPDPPLYRYVFPPADLQQTRLGNYREYPPRPHRAPRKKPQDKLPVPLFPKHHPKQLSLFSPKLLSQLRQVDK